LGKNRIILRVGIISVNTKGNTNGESFFSTNDRRWETKVRIGNRMCDLISLNIVLYFKYIIIRLIIANLDKQEVFNFLQSKKIIYFPVMVLFEALRQSYLKVIYLKYSIFILLFFNEGWILRLGKPNLCK
jgi:hypothetical protein